MKRIALLFCLFLTGCGIGGLPDFSNKQAGKIIVQPDTVYMKGNGWVFGYSPGMPVHPTDRAGGGWYFVFPSSDGVHYVRVPYHANKPHKTLTITYRVTGTKFVSVDAPCNGAGFSPMLERSGDMLAASQEFYRFWGKQILLKGDGIVHTAVYRLDDPVTWTGVFGKSNAGELLTTEQNLMMVGITFGGCFAGHGVYGQGQFELLDLKIE